MINLTLNKLKDSSTLKVLSYAWYLMIINFLGTAIWFTLYKAGLCSKRVHSASTTIAESEDMSMLLLTICFTGVVYPFFEEIAFRLALKPQSRFQIIAGISALIVTWLIRLTDCHLLLKPYTRFSFSISFILLCGAFYILFYYGLQHVRFYNIVKVVCDSRYFIYFTSGLFALFHIHIVGIPSHPLLYVPLLLPYFLTGLLLARAKIKEGFAYGFMAHAIFNLMLILLNFIMR